MHEMTDGATVVRCGLEVIRVNSKVSSKHDTVTPDSSRQR